MALDPETAIRIARQHGLGLPDARALMALADHELDAERYAEQFTAPLDPNDQFADWAEHQLNASPEERIFGARKDQK